MAYLPSKMTLRKEFVWNESFWTPEVLGGDLALWLDADDADTITLNGSNVAQWNDKSGNNYNVAQATASAQPIFGTRTLGGKNVLDFDGGDFLVSASHSFTTTGDMTVLVVASSDSATSEFASIIALDDSDKDWQFSATALSLPNFHGEIRAGFGEFATANTGPNNGPSIYGLNFDYTGSGVYNIFIDGERGSDDQAFTAQMDEFFTAHIMTNRVTNQSVDGLAAGVIITNTSLSLLDRQKAEGYLAWKWGLVANLPVSHPYKIAPPQRNI